MGLYSVSCTGCGATFPWFSGNTGNQICSECTKKATYGASPQYKEPSQTVPDSVNIEALMKPDHKMIPTFSYGPSQTETQAICDMIAETNRLLFELINEVIWIQIAMKEKQ